MTFPSTFAAQGHGPVWADPGQLQGCHDVIPEQFYCLYAQENAQIDVEGRRSSLKVLSPSSGLCQQHRALPPAQQPH